MSYKKVLIVSNMYPNKKYPSYGVFVKNFCTQLSDIGIDYNLSVLTKTQNKLVKLTKYGFFYLKTFFKAWLGRYDLVYIHYPSFSAAPVVVARKLRKFDIYTNVHGTDVVPLKATHEKMIGNTNKIINVSQKTIVPSDYYKQLVIKKYNVLSENVVVYPSAGVNERVFFEYTDNKKLELRTEYGISDENFVIGFVSRINRAKGWDVILDAIEKSDWIGKEQVTIFIVGSGEDDKELEKRILRLSPEKKETIRRYPLLPQQKLADIYNLLDVFVFPTMSASESLGLVAIEAMACGVPVIASNYAAPAYYVVDGVNGYKFEKGNSDGLNRRLNQVFRGDEMLRKKLKRGALETAEKYTKDRILKILNELFTG